MTRLCLKDEVILTEAGRGIVAQDTLLAYQKFGAVGWKYLFEIESFNAERYYSRLGTIVGIRDARTTSPVLRPLDQLWYEVDYGPVILLLPAEALKPWRRELMIQISRMPNLVFHDPALPMMQPRRRNQYPLFKNVR